MADDPDNQTDHAVGWTDGNLLRVGADRSGATAALATLAVTLTAGVPPGERHLYAVDMGAGELAALATIPHCGAVLAGGEGERRRRWVRRLKAEIDRRRAGAGGPEIVLLVAGL